MNISKYLYEGKRHAAYKDTVKMYHDFLVHSDEKYPKELIDERRPSESEKIKKYRQLIYKCQTSGSFGKVLNSLGKIRKSQDWSILHTKAFPKKVSEEETLENYMEQSFPLFGSFTKWYFDHALKQFLIDPNAVACVSPKYFNVEENEYLKPEVEIYNSDRVLEFNSEMVFVKSEETVSYQWDHELREDGEVYYLYTKTDIFKIEQFKPHPNNPAFKIILLGKNTLGYLPCRRLKGVFKTIKNNQAVYKSRLSACLPHWDEAIREYSDLQADVVQHMHETMWVWNSKKCSKCKGTGHVMSSVDGQQTVSPCGNCTAGTIPFNPYEHIEQRPPQAGEPAAPSPPAGYIEKSTSIVEIQDERIDRHIYKGLAAINFEFLAVQLNQSGAAKELDRGEFNAFVFDVAEDIIGFFDWCYKVSADWRYRIILSEEERKEILPRINVPEKYDIISESYIVDEIKKAKDGGINPFIINSLELEYANKKFSTDRDLKEFVRNSIELDPLSGIPDDQKLVRTQSGYIAKSDFIISNYITTFIRKALAENKDFYKLEFGEKQKVLLKFAKEVESKTTVADKFKIDDTRGDNQGDNGDN